jgi:hypothetical protein
MSANKEKEAEGTDVVEKDELAGFLRTLTAWVPTVCQST